MVNDMAFSSFFVWKKQYFWLPHCRRELFKKTDGLSLVAVSGKALRKQWNARSFAHFRGTVMVLEFFFVKWGKTKKQRRKESYEQAKLG